MQCQRKKQLLGKRHCALVHVFQLRVNTYFLRGCSKVLLPSVDCESLRDKDFFFSSFKVLLNFLVGLYLFLIVVFYMASENAFAIKVEVLFVKAIVTKCSRCGGLNCREDLHSHSSGG